MAIKIILGNVGSGKTATVVRDMVLNPYKRKTYSNIITQELPNNEVINYEMLIKKEVTGTKRNGDEVFKLMLNEEFWKEALKKHKVYNVVIDEAHTILSSRRSMSKINEIMSNFIALQRKILGTSSSGYGDLTLISQIDRRVDVNVREMCNFVRMCLCHYKKTCSECGFRWSEHNEIPEPIHKCPRCKNLKIVKHNHIIENWYFKNIDDYVQWKFRGVDSYFKHTFITDIEKYFDYYNTLQWDNLLLKI